MILYRTRVTKIRGGFMKKLILAVIVCFAFLLNGPFSAQASPLFYTTERIFGEDRIEPALAISQKGGESAETVILCEGSAYPDSIAAAPFAASLDAPILLTGGENARSACRRRLQRLDPQKVILLGGQALLTSSIETELADFLSVPNGSAGRTL
jgi:N-acetylmuramoyl-L-alanine amidase